jgi:hypothetical protein
MKKYENPINFDVEQECDKDLILYKNLSEIGQGSPVIGNLFINGKLLSEYRFGGPVLCDEKFIYAPAFIKRFFTMGFKLGAIERTTLNVVLLGSVKSLIFLDRIEGDRIYFYEDITKTRLSWYNLDALDR